ncbi:MAG: tRNA (N6-isopentenyl adenosine(37)-C2)-methylthiotransferase MiaB [candidate division KSB1 bacterium]|nr:tRNA (N6-isopentenyl adenosine(37)-C2)-methylthiotransferase MiaB [candidate division KSB1 bacterium]
MTRVYIETYGCQMNEYDTEIVKAVLLDSGYELSDSPEEAEVLLLNTCSVREHAARRVMARVHDLRRLPNGATKKIGLLGCLTTNLRKALLENKKMHIDLLAGPDSYRRLPELIAKANHEPAADLALSRTETYSDIRPVRTKSVNAWIAVMRGCDNYCTFCVVPYARGRERSRSIESIVREAKTVAAEGFKQVTLLGQNVNSYRYEGHDFAYLLQKVAEVEGLLRIRFTAPHPKDFPDSLLQVMKENPKICRHIHLPLQAGSDRILELMNRTYSQSDYLRLVEKIRSYLPDVALTTDIIVGFPTESEQDFEETVKVVESVQFDSAFIFKYSPRKGTYAARHFVDDVADEEKSDRAVRLNALQKEISLRKNRSRIGETHDILIEELHTRKSSLDAQGRTDGNILVIVPKEGLSVGDLIRVRIIGAGAHALKGERLDLQPKEKQ